LVGFGSEGCLLDPRSSITAVVAWAWSTWVVSRRRVLEAVFILLESPSPSRRIFIGSHSLPTSLVRCIGASSFHAHGSQTVHRGQTAHEVGTDRPSWPGKY
jgi:hypothetical protein